jgi:hypothetical protein
VIGSARCFAAFNTCTKKQKHAKQQLATTVQAASIRQSWAGMACRCVGEKGDACFGRFGSETFEVDTVGGMAMNVSFVVTVTVAEKSIKRCKNVGGENQVIRCKLSVI